MVAASVSDQEIARLHPRGSALANPFRRSTLSNAPTSSTHLGSSKCEEVEQMTTRRTNIDCGKPIVPKLPPTNLSLSEQVEECLEAVEAEKTAGKKHHQAIYRA